MEIIKLITNFLWYQMSTILNNESLTKIRKHDPCSATFMRNMDEKRDALQFV